jgi:YVTN family beta-propeller protein
VVLTPARRGAVLLRHSAGDETAALLEVPLTPAPGRRPAVTMTAARRGTAAALAAALACGCTTAPAHRAAPTVSASPSSSPSPARHDGGYLGPVPPLLDPHDVYAADRPGRLADSVRTFPSLVYVPNSESDTVDVIDPRTYTVVGHFAVGRLPQHVTPSYDLSTLWVDNDLGDSLTAIDPRTGRPGRTVSVTDPYNLYFTPDGRYAIVVAERLRRLDFRDAHTMRLVHSLAVPDCPGVDHLDFSAAGDYLVASCEFGQAVVAVDLRTQRETGRLALPGGKPQDVKLSPDGRTFWVADMDRGGVHLVTGPSLRLAGFLPTAAGAHGLYVSRDSRLLYVTNRDAGTVSVVSFATRRVVRTWTVPHGSPDMGGVSADGRVLWLSGRYDAEVYAIDTTSGRLLARIRVGRGPHGLCVFPQPGRYSTGHTGVFR